MNNLEKFFKNKKILITGHTGFKGSWLAKILLNWGADIIGIALKPNTSPNLFSLLGIKNDIKNYFCDIKNFKEVKEILEREKPEIVFHLAAQPLVRDSYDDPLYTFETNIIGTANILQAIKEAGCIKSAIIVTTDKVYEEKKGVFYKEDNKLGGFDPYSASKAAAEIIISSYIKSFFNPEDYNKSHKTLVASARAGNVIGGGDWSKDRIIPDIIKSIFEKNEKLIIRSPDSIRPWQWILEPLYGYLLLAQNLYEGKKEFSGAWNFGPDNQGYLTVESLVKKMLEILDMGDYTIKKDSKKHEAKYLKLDIDKAKNILGWEPVLDINKTLELTLNWYKSFYGEKNIVEITSRQIKEFFEKI